MVDTGFVKRGCALTENCEINRFWLEFYDMFEKSYPFGKERQGRLPLTSPSESATGEHTTRSRAA